MSKQPPCLLCGGGHGHRRGLCRRCYRKLRDCNVPLPPKRRAGPPPWTLEGAFARWAAEWPAAHREALARALLAAEGKAA